MLTTPSQHFANTINKLGATNMTAILYAIGFTLSFCLSMFFGYSPDTPIFQQGLMVFSGFCMGGMALCVIDEMR